MGVNVEWLVVQVYNIVAKDRRRVGDGGER